IEIYPILGVGTAPFRGNFRPDNWREMVRNYPSVQTLTVQSAFKFDFPEGQVREALVDLKETGRGGAMYIDEQKSRQIIEKSSKEYSDQIGLIAPLVNSIADHIPARRKRKLHIGLFGYSRSVDEVQLPRAITFCSALYSIGLPPEMLGLSCLSERELEFFRDADTAFDDDLRDAMQYFNPAVKRLLPAELTGKLREDLVEFSPNERHIDLTGRTIDAFVHGKREEVRSLVVESAWIRRFLG
ncbi:MAG TPA: phosphoenolpyruvate carboxylase, partial [Euryarchaeota archaeon]|nr:phosphoenolpyruvate carboxylase [Euryarchaeota archaeon]